MLNGSEFMLCVTSSLNWDFCLVPMLDSIALNNDLN